MQKTRRCKGCKRYTKEYIVINLSAFCDKECAVSHALNPKSLAQGKKLIEQQERRELRARKEKLNENNTNHWIKKAQAAFNPYIRFRDRNEPCISCGRSPEEVEGSESWKPGGSWDCGHYLSVGSHPELRFEPLNAHRQCKSCNGGSGNYSKKNWEVAQSYRKNLIEKIGLDQVLWLESKHEPKRYRAADLKEIEAHFKTKLKTLKAEVNTHE